MVLIIRRMRCEMCKKIHHELPDILVPYKRYVSESIEEVISTFSPIHVAADESTLYRWKSWFNQWAPYAIGCLTSIGIQLQMEQPAWDLSEPTQTVLQKIGRFVEESPGWLSRVVRSLSNIHLWVHTRSAFLSKTP